ncbi:MAG TPA: hypothetical protein VF637_12075 [Sphingomicrobium sp.]|jgi:hypothetical protein
MAGFSTYLQAAILGWIKGTAMPAAPSAVYVALFSADPTDAGTLTNEVTTTIRAAGRVAATFGAVSTGSGTGTIANSAAVDFGTAAGGATVTHFGVFDAASAGNMLGSGTITGGTISTGNAVSFAAGSLTISAS